MPNKGNAMAGCPVSTECKLCAAFNATFGYSLCNECVASVRWTLCRLDALCPLDGSCEFDALRSLDALDLDFFDCRETRCCRESLLRLFLFSAAGPPAAAVNLLFVLAAGKPAAAVNLFSIGCSAPIGSLRLLNAL